MFSFQCGLLSVDVSWMCRSIMNGLRQTIPQEHHENTVAVFGGINVRKEVYYDVDIVIHDIAFV